MSAIAHLLCEYVGRVDFAGNMGNIKSLVLHPLADGILLKFYMPGHFGCHIIGPFNASIIVVVEDCRRINIQQGMARLGHTLRQVAKVNDLL